MDYRLNTGAKTIKLLKHNIEVNLGITAKKTTT